MHDTEMLNHGVTIKKLRDIESEMAAAMGRVTELETQLAQATAATPSLSPPPPPSPSLLPLSNENAFTRSVFEETNGIITAGTNGRSLSLSPSQEELSPQQLCDQWVEAQQELQDLRRAADDARAALLHSQAQRRAQVGDSKREKKALESALEETRADLSEALMVGSALRQKLSTIRGEKKVRSEGLGTGGVSVFMVIR